MSTIYKQERNHPNWTGRVSRQSRITGEWSRNRTEDKIPGVAYVVGVLALAVIYLAAYL